MNATLTQFFVFASLYSGNLNLNFELHYVPNFSELVQHNLPTMPPEQAAPVRAAIRNRITVEAVVGDVTTFPADVIANAANIALRGGNGSYGAIHGAAGPPIWGMNLGANFPGGVVGAYITAAHKHRYSTIYYLCYWTRS
jgi:hypothetical protein